MSIFKQAKIAMFDFDAYPSILINKTVKVILYSLFFILTLNLFSVIFPFITSYEKTGGFDNFVKEYVPDFTIKDDKLVFDKYSKENTPLNITFVFEPDDKNLAITNQDKEDSCLFIFKFTPSHMVAYPNNISVNISDIIKMFNIKQKSDLINLKPFISLCNFIGLLVLFLLLIYKDIIMLILSCFLISVVCSFYGIKTNFSNIFKLSVYINTMPYILSKIFSFFNMNMPNIIYLGIVLAYLNFILKIIKQELLKQQNDQNKTC